MVDVSRNVLVWQEYVQNNIEQLRVLVSGNHSGTSLLVAGLKGLGVKYIGATRETEKYNSYFFNKEHFKEKKSDLVSYFENNTQISLFKPNVILSINDSEKTLENLLQFYCNNSPVPVFAARADLSDLILSSSLSDRTQLNHALGNEIFSPKDTFFSGCVAAGHLLEDLRRFVHCYDEDETIVELPSKISFSEKQNLSDLHVGVIGAGGIGTYAALSTAMQGADVTIIDYDTVERTNLNRQFAYATHVGEKKASTLASFIHSLDSRIQCNYIIGKVGDLTQLSSKECLQKAYYFDLIQYEKNDALNPFSGKTTFDNYLNYHYESCSVGDVLKTFDIILGCVDNKYARLYLSQFCLEHSICYIDGATSATRGKIVAYQPNVSSSISEQISLHSMTLPRRQDSCAVAPEGSVVMSNMVIGGMLCAATCEYVNGPTRKIRGVDYNATALEKLVRY